MRVIWVKGTKFINRESVLLSSAVQSRQQHSADQQSQRPAAEQDRRHGEAGSVTRQHVRGNQKRLEERHRPAEQSGVHAHFAAPSDHRLGERCVCDLGRNDGAQGLSASYLKLDLLNDITRDGDLLAMPQLSRCAQVEWGAELHCCAYLNGTRLRRVQDFPPTLQSEIKYHADLTHGNFAGRVWHCAICAGFHQCACVSSQ